MGISLACAQEPTNNGSTSQATGETDGGQQDTDSEEEESGTNGDGDSCGQVECPTANPCQGIDCCDAGDPNCEPLFHDTQVVLAWSNFSSDCLTGCHSGLNPTAGLSLLFEDDPWCSLVDKPSSGPSPLNLVEPGEPLQSYLWHKLNASHTCPAVGGDGTAMPPPPNHCPLASENPALMSVVTKWICCGAPKSPEDPFGAGCF